MTIQESAPVLDLRPVATAQVRHLSGLVVDRPTRHAGAGGYTVAAQRKTMKGHPTLCVRLTAPDGRTVSLAAPRPDPAARIEAAVGTLLSPAVAVVLSARHLSSRQQLMAALVIESTLDEALSCVTEGVSGDAALPRVVAAVAAVDQSRAQSYDAWYVLGHQDSAAMVLTVGWLTQSGFTSQSAAGWFADPYRVRSRDTVRARAAFRDHGWTPAQMWILREWLREDHVAAGGELDEFAATEAPQWAALGFDDALLSAKAGLPAGTAHHLQRTGEWNEEALRTVVALRIASAESD